MTQHLVNSNNGYHSVNPSLDVVNSFTRQPLAIIVTPSGECTVSAGEIFELRVTVKNQGSQGALVNVYIDETSGLLRNWCKSPYKSLGLADNHSDEVVFEFEIPFQATPDIYDYQLVIDAPNHYPEDTPIQYSYRLQVLPPVQSAVLVNDPTFTILPATSSSSPAEIQPGEPLDIRVIVHNRSNRVDRFRLICPDIPKQWFTVVYPEGINDVGLVIKSNSLALNPSAQGEIFLQLHLPWDMKAGSYFPTIGVISANNQNLVLMDVVYLQVLPSYKLNLELRAIVGNVKRKAGLYRLLISNNGNTSRDISFRAKGDCEDELCTYTFNPNQLKITAKETKQIDFQALPTKWWRRPWFGKGLPIQFYVELEDAYQLPLPIDIIEGTLVWEARPWWHLLSVILAGAGAIASLIFVIWWLLFRPPVPPKIVEFSSTAPFYQQVEGDTVYLNWQIRHPKQLRKIQIIGLSPTDGSIVSPRESYDFSQGIPSQLKKSCKISQVLTCNNVRTNARQAGSYVFQIEAFSKKGEMTADAMKTHTIKIEPEPLPKIVDFTSTQPIYQEATSNKSTLANGSSISLNWKIVDPKKLQELQLIGRAADGSVISPLRKFNFSQGIPGQLAEFCILSKSELICRRVPTADRAAGDYIFELLAITSTNAEPTASKKTDTIKIKPQQIPIKILSFKFNGKEALPKYVMPLNSKVPLKVFNLSWKVEGSKDTKVELLPAPGNVPLIGEISYPISQKAGWERIILRATNGSGQEINRSIVIEKINYTPEQKKTQTTQPNSTASSTTSKSSLPNSTPPQSSSSPNPKILPTPSKSPLPANTKISPTPSQSPLPTNTKISPTPSQSPLPANTKISPTPSQSPLSPNPKISPTPSQSPPPQPPLPELTPSSPVELPPQFR